MIVIADTSPLNYLVLIGEAEILKRLYGRVVIPEAVWRELQHPQTPAAVATATQTQPTRTAPVQHAEGSRWQAIDNNDWCERGDSNPHPLRDQILSLARLPIPPLSQSS
jgi:hypothetical protein